MYEATLKRGRALLEKSQSPEDRQQLADLVSELRDSWDTINGKSMERLDHLEGLSGESYIYTHQYIYVLIY